jgi:hypothetical protein
MLKKTLHGITSHHCENLNVKFYFDYKMWFIDYMYIILNYFLIKSPNCIQQPMNAVLIFPLSRTL